MKGGFQCFFGLFPSLTGRRLWTCPGRDQLLAPWAPCCRVADAFCLKAKADLCFFFLDRELYAHEPTSLFGICFIRTEFLYLCFGPPRLPITSVSGSNSLWVESFPGARMRPACFARGTPEGPEGSHHWHHFSGAVLRILRSFATIR